MSVSDDVASLSLPEREVLARVIAKAVTGCHDVDIVVVPEWPALQRVAGGFVIQPIHGEPLWSYFLEAADAVIAHRS